MSFNEDYSRIRKENSPDLMAIIRQMALNLLQQAKRQEAQLKRASIKGLRKMCSWHEKRLDLIISKKTS